MMAAGVEYREESVSDVPDDQFQRGLIFGTESVSAAAAARQLVGVRRVLGAAAASPSNCRSAGRYDDYSDFGNTTNPKVALRWAPIDSLAFRASWGEGFRAPSLAQIGLGPSQESRVLHRTRSAAPTTRRTARRPDFHDLIFSGNPDLQAEESENFNVGVVWQPTASTSMSLDYWDIKQDNKIDEVPRGFIYKQECNNQASTICVRGTPLPGDTLGPAAVHQQRLRQHRQQSTQGVDLSRLPELRRRRRQRWRSASTTRTCSSSTRSCSARTA